jgi:hypothetical protein
MSTVMILVCEGCGKRLKAAGATPGRVGKCPACGSLLRVPEDEPDAPASPRAEATPGGYDLLPDPTRREATSTVPRRARGARPAAPAPEEEGRAARRPDGSGERFRDCLIYPFQDTEGIALLLFLPPVLWLTSLGSFGLIPGYIMQDNEVTTMGALTLFFPMLCGFAMTLGYALSFLGRVLVSTAQGEDRHPRWPPWEFLGVLGTLGRWIWAGGLGIVLAGLPALAFGRSREHLGAWDWAIIAAIMAPGVAYSLMSLLAVLLHEDFRAANPITILAALARVGPASLKVVLLTAMAALPTLFAIPLLFRLPGFLLPLACLWAFWLFAMYEAMVVLRVLGLFYRRHADALGWFPDRPQWGR